MRKNNRRGARVARFFIFEAQTTLDRSSKYFILCLCMKAIRDKQLKLQVE